MNNCGRPQGRPREFKNWWLDHRAHAFIQIRGRYDDGGFTGGNMDRPALQRLIADIEAGKIDCVVVHKVDRLSRSLLDFARMMETVERYHVSFASVTQHFNTSTSIGRSPDRTDLRSALFLFSRSQKR